ncbi:MAG: hypothetical protein AAB974_03050 [Patescibacteria group bacterium]
MAHLIAEVSLGQVSELIARLGRAGMDPALLKKALGDDELVERMVTAARTESQDTPTPTSFPIWKTIQIGGKTKDQLIAEIEAKGMKIGDYAQSMLAKEAFTTLPKPCELTLVRPTVAELGFKKGAVTKNIWKRAQDLGLSLCPAEVGPHLRLVDADQASGDYYWIGMEPITGAGVYPDVFMVGRGDCGRWLFSSGAWPGDHWFPEFRLVFVAPGK